MKIVTIIPLKKGAFIEDLAYFTTKEILVGSIVSVPLRNKDVLGLVISSDEVINSKGDIKNMSFNLKKIIEDKGKSIFRIEYFDSIMLTGRYFVSKKNDAVTSLVPSVFRENYDEISLFKNETFTSNNIEKNSIKIKTEKLLLQLNLSDRISIYKTLIRESFAAKKSIFLIFPNEREVKLFYNLLSHGIEDFSFFIYSGLSPKKTIEQFSKIIGSTHPVLILGTTQFLSIPRYDIGTIILENENANGYKMLSRPYFDLRIFVEIFASKISARLIFADTMLRFETIGRKDIDNLSPMHPLSFRLNFDGEIEISSKNLSIPGLEPRIKGFRIFTDKNIQEIQGSLLKKENVFIFSLRKGLATITVCRDCNEPLMCKNCGAPIVLYTSRNGSKRMYICNRCKTQMDTDTICQKCGSWNLIPLGIGTDTVVEELKKSLRKEKEVRIFQLDKDSAKSKSGAEKIIRDFEKTQGTILVGTEMSLFYLKDKIPLSIIASFDSFWSIPNFKMNEKIIQLIISIISKTSKKIIIQTKNDTDRVMEAIKSENLSSFVQEELEDKRELGYPPYKRFIKIIFQGDKEETLQTKEILNQMFKEYNPEIFSGFIAKQKGKYITNALLKVNLENWSIPEISSKTHIDENLHTKLFSLPNNFSVNIDPEDLL
jgi:primosomal protein N' (replication factor Y)